MRDRRTRAVSVALIAASLSLSACANRFTMSSIGGDWYEYVPQSIVIEAGSPPSHLYRAWHGWRVLVSEDVMTYKYYPKEDCLLWETTPPVIYAACFSHEPIRITRNEEREWRMEDRGLVIEEETRLNASGQPVKPATMFSLDAIAYAEGQQPEYTKDWSPRIAREDRELVPVDVEVPISLRATEGLSGRTALMEAAHRNRESRIDLVNALIAQGADVNATDKYGFTALMIAADYCDPDVVARLLEAGADVAPRNVDSETALMKAAGAIYDPLPCVTMLLDAGADKYVRDKYDHTAFNKIRTNTDPQLKVLLAVQ